MEAVEERRFLNPRVHRSYRAVGVDVGGTKIACAIVSFEGLQPPVLSYHKEVPTEAALGGEHVMGTIIGVVRACLDEARGGAWVSAQAQAGDTRALQVLHDAGFALGESIASWVNILDPELVILAGSVCRAGAPWREALSAGYQSQALDPVAQTRIVDAALGGEAPLIGAAEDLLDSLELTGL